MVYLDVMLAFFETHEDHFDHLRQVLRRIRRHWVEIEITKMSVSERRNKVAELCHKWGRGDKAHPGQGSENKRKKLSQKW